MEDFEELETKQTKRVVAPKAEEILGKHFKCLNKGFVRLVSYEGSDESIVQAARVSYGKGTKKISEDAALVHYLMKHRHSTPFEMITLKFHIKAPIFVFRQLFRHRTSSINEYSARYSIMEDDFYLPDNSAINMQSKDNKQGRLADDNTPDSLKEKFVSFISEDNERCYSHYDELQKEGVAKELARIGLNVNIYSMCYWQQNLHNLFHLLNLRLDPHAQYEIRVYAEAMAKCAETVAPIAYEAFQEHVVNAKHFSRYELNALREMLAGKSLEEIEFDKDKSQRKKKEFVDKIEYIRNL